MKQVARALETATAGQAISVEIRGVSACARCARAQGCGAGIVSQGGTPVQLRCLSELAVSVGDDVIVEFDDGDSRWVWLLAGAYGLPTVGLVLATMVAALLLPDETVTSAAGLAGDGIMAALSRDALQGLAAVFGLAGGLIAWRYLAPRVSTHLETSLCLDTGRIVAAGGHVPRESQY